MASGGGNTLPKVFSNLLSIFYNTIIYGLPFEEIKVKLFSSLEFSCTEF